MFNRNRKQKMNNAAAGVIPPAPPSPPAQTVHNHTTAWGWVIIASFPCLVALGPLLWWAGVFLFDQAGVKRPERAMAELLILAAIVLPLLAAFAWFGSGVLEQVHTHKQAMKALEIEALRYTSLTAGAPALPDGRLTEEQKKLFENLALVMETAYRDLAAGGPYKGGNVQRPWSKAAVLALDPPRHGRMSWGQATKIRDWLVERGVVTGEPQNDQINVSQFPAWQDFRVLLESEFSLPVRVIPGRGQAPTLLAGRYDPIDI